MFGWRRKSDGFEWHEHVRTTIRIRREDRRRRIDEARALAAEGLSSAGRAGMAAGTFGLNFLGQCARRLGEAAREGVALVISLLPIIGEAIRTGLTRALTAAAEGSAKALLVLLDFSRRALILAFEALMDFGRRLNKFAYAAARILGIGVDAIGQTSFRLLVIGCKSLRHSTALPLMVLVGVVASVAAIIRLATSGTSADAVFALVIGGACLIGALLVRMLGDSTVSLSTSGYDLALLPQEQRKPYRFRVPLPAQTGRAAGLAAAVLVACSALIGGGWLVWTGASHVVSAASSTGLFAEKIEGRAEAVAGDVLRIGGREIKLAGIEAPEPAQRCAITGNRSWRCGAAARIALSRMLRGKSVSCSVSGTDEKGRSLGTCVAGGDDIASMLVAGGHVFAETGLFAKYDAEEEKARAEKAGIWRGNPERPAEYRARVEKELARAWEAAKRRAPRGCPIKGNIIRGRKYYVLPGTPEYRRVRIETRRGERWFCSEEEAIAAGWKRSPRG